MIVPKVVVSRSIALGFSKLKLQPHTRMQKILVTTDKIESPPNPRELHYVLIGTIVWLSSTAHGPRGLKHKMMGRLVLVNINE